MASTLAAKRPFLSLPFLLPSSCELMPLTSRRSQSSYRRTKQRLRVKPDASFGSSLGQVERDHIVYNPPSSSPSVYHTPAKFLPSDDIRRSLVGDTSISQQNHAELASLNKSPGPKRYHLNPSDVLEIRRLRTSDPMTWSRSKLAKRFDCSPLFISMVCGASREKKEMQKQVLEAVQSRWGTKRRMAREDRTLRKESWGRDR
ncbi:hypothetical protein ASPACDRAFT_77465 [Aspergillus aculeatus ATCC 16872]|uniref:60S ribosomal protein L20 n=1 Tax=Aspergillus aculeatus (strain ATCC 16872 / CBS 172.66 / WB 5094) TaxID=690307 RepID=A0A1L9WWK9_ASPA1|nr:uncharacterized protein ASPACDRAFT_77465 [Aspergillus aculeatus ATCC 16872]OJK00612.1 hypothetical protein ASPACDRAFT_77465 [Aspergillus aculeatus ATCC 16872]